MLTLPHLSVSNIGFPGAELDEALALLQTLGLTGVEIAPFNVWGRWDVTNAEVDALRRRLNTAGFNCPAMQGIVYNAGPAHLFTSADSRAAMHDHLTLVARMAGRLGATACVFGAPRLRDPGELPEADARAIAIDFLRGIGPVFAAEGSTLAFEPNARQYACRFITTTTEAIALVQDVNTPGIALQIDTGTLFLEHEDPVVLTRAVPLAVHAHVSEPNLAPIGSTDMQHTPLAEALRAAGYAGSLSIEMKSVPQWRLAIPHAVSVTREFYLQ